MPAWPNIDQYLDSLRVQHGVPTWAQTECGVACGHSVTSLHPLGRARDYGNIDTPGGNAGCDAIFRALEPFAVGPNYILQELFWNPIGCWQRGNRIGAVSGHWDHVHAGLAFNKFLPIAETPEPPPRRSVAEDYLLS